MERDKEVTEELQRMGWIVLRFWGKDIEKNVDKCLAIIEETIIEQKMGK